MLTDFKTEWTAIWTLGTGLKVGVPIEALTPDIGSQIDNLNLQVAKYQQIVTSFNADKDGVLQVPLIDKLQPVFFDIKVSQEDLQAALDLQILFNKNTALGQLQRPSESPAKVSNPTLADLKAKLSHVVGAMEMDLVIAGLSSVTQEPVRGVIMTAQVVKGAVKK